MMSGVTAGAIVAPGAHAAGVDVHETGTRIVADAASPESQGRVPKDKRIYSWNANIDSVRLHVQAVSRDTGRSGAKKRIAPRGAVAANDINLGIRVTNGSRQVCEDVEDMRIIVLHVAGAMVAEEMIQLLLRLRGVFVAMAIDNVNVLAGVGVVEAYAV